MSGSGNDGTPADTNYMYYKYIKTPSDLGMSPGYNLSNISDGVGGIVSYIKLLVEGKSPASKTGKTLGNKYFYTTSQNVQTRLEIVKHYPYMLTMFQRVI